MLAITSNKALNPKNIAPKIIGKTNIIDTYKNIWVIPIVEDTKIETKEYKGYDIEEIIPLDMFPQTANVETLVSLKLK